MSKKILIADDDPAILDSMQELLEDEGYIVETAADGRTVEEVEDELPDLILLDIWMSGIDGRDIARKLKSQEATRHIPIVMFSANKDTEKIARESGAEDFLAKPFEIDELLDKVAKYTR